MMYSDIFNEAFNEVIRLEGGYVNNPNDPGGETKYGISKRAFPNINIKDLTISDAQKIYYDNYWNTKRLNLDKIADYSPKVAIELFQQGVNSGVSTSAENLQKALNLMNRNGELFPDMKVDGWVGPVTISCLNKLEPYDKPSLLKVINGLQFMIYYNIVEKNPIQEKFFSGWMKRV